MVEYDSDIPPREYGSFLRDLAPAPHWLGPILERIHVYDHKGARTLICFDDEGNMAKVARPNFTLPIQLFDPNHHGALAAYVEQRISWMRSRGWGDEELAAVRKRMASGIVEARQYLATTRPEDYLYRPTPDEERQIARVAVELCKYPAISSSFADTLPEDPGYYWLVAPTGKGPEAIDNSATHHLLSGLGFGPSFIVIGDQKYSQGRGTPEFRLVVAEETHHAFYELHSEKSRKLPISYKATDAIGLNINMLKDLVARYELHVLGRGSVAFTPEEAAFLREYEAYAAGNDAWMKFFNAHALVGTDPRYRTIAMLREEIAGLREIVKFEDDPLYQDTMRRQPARVEVYARTGMVLNLQRHMDLTEAGLRSHVEPWIFDTPDLGAIVEEMNRHRDLYERNYTREQRVEVQAWAATVARKLDRERPGITGFAARVGGRDTPLPPRG